MAQYYFNLGEELGAAYAAAGFPSRGFISTEYLSLSITDDNTDTTGVVSLSSDGLTISRGAEVDPVNGLTSGFIRSPVVTFNGESVADFELYFTIRTHGFEPPSNFSNNGINIFYRLGGVIETGNINELSNAVNHGMGGRESGSADSFYYENDSTRIFATTGNTGTTGSLGLFANSNRIIHTRFKVVGERIRRKQWRNGETEPSSWDADFSLNAPPIDANPTGFIAITLVTNSISATILNMAIGTGGDDAPTAPVINPPTSNTRFVSGTVTLDGQPYSSRLVVTSVGDEPAVVGTGLSDVDGNYNIPVGTYDSTVLVNSVQDYGDNWQPSTTLEFDQVIHPTVPNGYVFRVTSVGTTGTQEPTWPALPATQVTDGGVTYTSEILLEPVIQGYVTPTLV